MPYEGLTKIKAGKYAAEVAGIAVGLVANETRSRWLLEVDGLYNYAATKRIYEMLPDTFVFSLDILLESAGTLHELWGPVDLLRMRYAAYTAVPKERRARELTEEQLAAAPNGSKLRFPHMRGVRGYHDIFRKRRGKWVAVTCATDEPVSASTHHLLALARFGDWEFEVAPSQTQIDLGTATATWNGEQRSVRQVSFTTDTDGDVHAMVEFSDGTIYISNGGLWPSELEELGQLMLPEAERFKAADRPPTDPQERIATALERLVAAATA